jgi:hypothetical protein
VQPKLLSNSETDVAADGHKQRTRGMRQVPIHPEPNMHSGAHAYVGRHSRQQDVAAAPPLSHSCDAIILRMQPGERGSDEPFTGRIFRFIGPVRKPETRFEVTPEASCLRTLRTQELMEILIRYEPLEVEKTGVSPIRCHKPIGRTRAGLQTRREQISICGGQVCAPCWNLGAERDG